MPMAPVDGGAATAGRIERAIVTAANFVWAVVGLVLWIPQVVRVVLTSVVRLVHCALTRQPAEAVRGPIRRVSYFYADGFLRPGHSRSGAIYRSRELRLGRFLTEALWVTGFWLLVLALVRRQTFDLIWGVLVASGVQVWGFVVATADRAGALLPDALPTLTDLRTLSGVAVAVAVLLVALAAGFWLGRMRR